MKQELQAQVYQAGAWEPAKKVKKQDLTPFCKQEDLADCAPQSRISDILNGKRPVSKAIAKKLAGRFNVSAGLFI